ncbi:MAG: PDZ domain-containing protein, partial [Pyrinomonadaceae bacterium]|nr:PDZ domain-containing protein [Pyrinomonadaceae bacterium]
GLLGMSVEPLTPEIAAQLDLPRGTEGVVVVGVDPSGPAAEAEIRRGDVIEQVNRQPVRSTADLRAALERSGDRPSLVLINRRGNSFFVTLRPRR